MRYWWTPTTKRLLEKVIFLAVEAHVDISRFQSNPLKVVGWEKWVWLYWHTDWFWQALRCCSANFEEMFLSCFSKMSPMFVIKSNEPVGMEGFKIPLICILPIFLFLFSSAECRAILFVWVLELETGTALNLVVNRLSFCVQPLQRTTCYK